MYFCVVTRRVQLWGCLEIGVKQVLWPDVKMMPTKWEKWSEHPKSICQRILSLIGVPRQVTKEEYWLGVGATMANDKLCAIRSNMKQTMFKQFKGKKWSAGNYFVAFRATNIAFYSFKHETNDVQAV